MFNRLQTIATILALLATVALADEPNPPGRTLTGHKGSVLSVEFTRDGKTLVSGSRDHTIKIWDIATGELKQTLTNHSADVYSVVFSHDGKFMASGSADKTIILWDAQTCTPIKTLKGHTAAIRYLAFSPDDQTLASASEDKTLKLWNVATGALKATGEGHTARVKTVAYFPDGNTIVTASSDATIRLWDAKSAAPLKVLKGHKNGVEFCDVSPDGHQLFSGTANIGQVIFWNAQTGEILKDIPDAHGNKFGAEIDSGHYSPDGRWDISGSKDRTDKCWDTKTFQLLHTISGNPGRSESLAFSPDGKTLATGFGGTDSTIRLWDLSQWFKQNP